MTDTDTAEWAPPASRTIADVAADLKGLDDRLSAIETPLRAPRQRLAGSISTSDDPAFLAACRAEYIGPLEAAEAAVITAFDAVVVQLQADERLLDGSGFTPRLDPDDAARLPASLAIAQAHLERFDAPDIAAMVRTSLLHHDRATLAAYASLAGILASRGLPNDHGARSALADARRAVEDPAARRIGEELRAAITTAQARRFAIVEAANAEQPGSQGSYLERYAFGRAPIGGPAPQAARGADWHRLMRRCGRTA